MGGAKDCPSCFKNYDLLGKLGKSQSLKGLASCVNRCVATIHTFKTAFMQEVYCMEKDCMETSMRKRKLILRFCKKLNLKRHKPSAD